MTYLCKKIKSSSLITLFFGSVYFLFFISYATAASGGMDGSGANGGLINPLKAKTITDFLLAIIDILLTFAVPVIIFFIMYGGFKLVTARGDMGQIEDGRSAITWAVIGGVIVLAAKLIINVIQGTVEALKVASL